MFTSDLFQSHMQVYLKLAKGGRAVDWLVGDMSALQHSVSRTCAIWRIPRVTFFNRIGQFTSVSD